MKRFVVLLLLLCLCATPAQAETIKLLGVSLPDAFEQEHPGVEVIRGGGEDWIFDTNILLGQLLTREFDYDVFDISTESIDVKQLMSKGYCLDLSQSEILTQAVARMWPNFAAQAVWDGKLYGFPNAAFMTVMICQEDVWQEAGLTQEDVPQTYRAFLDFLREWIQRQQEDPRDIRVFNSMDELNYDEHWYAFHLVDMLLENHIQQCQYAGEPIRFDDPELLSLLMEAKSIGDALYQLEPALASRGPGPALFNSVAGNFEAWGHMTDWFVPLRLREDQPMLVPMNLSMSVVNAGTDNPELAIQALEASVQTLLQSAQMLLYQDFGLVEQENYPSERRYTEGLIATVENALANPDATLAECVDLELFAAPNEQRRIESFQYWWTKIRAGEDLDEAEEALARWKAKLENETGRWVMTPEELRDYANIAPTVIFPGPSVFTEEQQSQNYRRMIQRYVDGEQSPKDLVTALDRIVTMVEMEGM